MESECKWMVGFNIGLVTLSEMSSKDEIAMTFVLQDGQCEPFNEGLSWQLRESTWRVTFETRLESVFDIPMTWRGVFCMDWQPERVSKRPLVIFCA